MGSVTKEDEKAIRREIAGSSIPEMLKALYLLADAVSVMSSVSFRRIRRVFREHGYETRENDLLTGITKYCELTKAASWQFERRVEPQIIGATFQRGDGSTDIVAYDRFNADANEICRLLLLYIDRCAKSREGYAKVFTLLRRLPSGGIVKDEDIAMFKMK